MRYSNDPYWLATKHPGHCAGCGGSFPAGAKVFYYPKGKHCYGGPCKCAEAASRDFEAAAWDEESYG